MRGLAQAEPSLEELLAEPIVQTLMRRDGVRREEILRMADALRAKRRNVPRDERTDPRSSAPPPVPPLAE